MNLFAQQCKMTREEYIKKFSPLAVEEMKKNGIPASITIAQALHESEDGNSTLATLANNHFGIKCTSDWKGKTFLKNDDRPDECFRKYESAGDSYHDHSEFLKRDRYAKLLRTDIRDYKAWAKGLKESGYATNPRYPDILIRIIEENHLDTFDAENVHIAENIVIKSQNDKSPKPSVNDAYYIKTEKRQVFSRNDIRYIIAREGDTFESLTKEFDMWKWQLPKYNDEPKDFQIKQGQVIYLQPKRNKAENGKEYHVFETGDTMYDISQLYGIKLSVLYKINNLKPDAEPASGQKLKLR
ncbi:MAG: glucosaminidase domain-containing protein [Bacteroidia bacterium]|nr:glucosaminidase domain-containing protein [Bacteroidia bacterium]